MHPGRGPRRVEIASDVADNQSVILDQVTNVAVRMAVMFLLSGGAKGEAAMNTECGMRITECGEKV